VGIKRAKTRIKNTNAKTFFRAIDPGRNQFDRPRNFPRGVRRRRRRKYRFVFFFFFFFVVVVVVPRTVSRCGRESRLRLVRDVVRAEQDDKSDAGRTDREESADVRRDEDEEQQQQQQQRETEDEESVREVLAVRAGGADLFVFFPRRNANRANAGVVLAVAELVERSNERFSNAGRF
jgi:hypothetical protein